ncbi:MAG: peptidyl-prolyl cis-trans isomerase [Chthoniobacterales bacterium]|nr:peptidyl-prolyl cis-trans isomerase [Chthoniobacterales bacterium]
MINVLRKNQKGLWIVIALLCIPFVFYFSNSNIGAVGKNEIGHIYGKPVSTVELQRSARLFNLARELGMFQFLQDMVATAQSENEAYAEFTWNRLILQHEAKRLGIRPLQNEVVDVIRGLQPFRGDAGFDINKYTQFTKARLPAMGFGDAQLEELASDSITLGRVKELVGVGAQVPATESQENYERAYGKLDVVVARVRREDLAKDVRVTDEEIGKYYEAHKAELMSEEKRKVSLVTFALTQEQKGLLGRERTEPLQKLADRANDFTQALLEKGADFPQIAAKFEVPVESTGEFTKSTPDPAFAANPQVASYAFELSSEQPNSDPIQSPEDFKVLHLEGIAPAQPLTLEEARPKIVDTLKQQRVSQLVATQGTEASAKIRAALKAGTPPEQAIQQAGLQPERIPPFALMDQPGMNVGPDKQPQPEAPDLNNIKGAVAEMNAGDGSDFVPTENGGFVAVLEKREQPAAGEGSERARLIFTSQLLRNKREVAFREWLQERRTDAGVAQQQAPTTFDFDS